MKPASPPREQLADFCRRNHIRRLSLFGSVLREDFGPESDIVVTPKFLNHRIRNEVLKTAPVQDVAA